MMIMSITPFPFPTRQHVNFRGRSNAGPPVLLWSTASTGFVGRALRYDVVL